MSAHRFAFAHKLPKRSCPACHRRTLRTYLDLSTGEEFDQVCGMCDRENNCSYHYTPYQYMIDNNIGGERSNPLRRAIPIPAPKVTSWRCPAKVVEATMDHRGNVFAKWLVGALGEKAKQALRMYSVGTYPASEKRPELVGAMVYWQIGLDQLHRSGKIIPYGPNGKRNKDLKAEWVHSVAYRKSMNELGIGQVLYGTNLLLDRPDAPVAVVESEKSAIIASIFYPDHVWLATGGSHNLSAELCMCLAGRDVTLFPDKGMYQSWSNKATQIGLDVLCNSLVVSDILEAMGEASEGSDIADGLMYADDKGYFNYFEAAGIDLFPDVLTDEARAILDADEEVQVINFDHVPGPLKPIQSPIDRLVASNPAIGKLVTELDLDISRATVKPIEP